jgi:agmatinase
MARIRELTQQTLQIGIRSMSLEEAERIRDENMLICTVHDLRHGNFVLEAALNTLPEPVFITFDVDVFDWSVVRSTGTPEPGGLLWDEALELLQKIFYQKIVIGFDVVELAFNEHDRNSPFAVAKLIYKMIGLKFFSTKNSQSV